jgi:haloacid dehalogenase superfamily, subfamily IA, variant 3 with third motif having DD or ED
MKIVLFDVDGTILDSMGAWENMGRIYLKSKGIDTSQNINNILYPLTSMQAASFLKNEYHLEDSIQEIIENFHKCLHDFYLYDVKLKEGIIDVLEEFKKHHYQLFIATASTKELVEKSFERLNINHYFNSIFTCDALGISKNDPYFYKKIAFKLQVKPKDIIVFEDSYNAALSAKKAGMKVIGVYDQYTRGHLQDIVHTYINKWEELL